MTEVVKKPFELVLDFPLIASFDTLADLSGSACEGAASSDDRLERGVVELPPLERGE